MLPSTKQWQNIVSSSFSTATATRTVTPGAFLHPQESKFLRNKLSLNYATLVLSAKISTPLVFMDFLASESGNTECTSVLE